jgi:hypothetical protein
MNSDLCFMVIEFSCMLAGRFEASRKSVDLFKDGSLHDALPKHFTGVV